MRTDTHMRTDTTARDMPGGHERRETYDLIGSEKVEGTNVYRSDGEKIGQIVAGQSRRGNRSWCLRTTS